MMLKTEPAPNERKRKNPRPHAKTQDYTKQEKITAVTAMLANNREHPLGAGAVETVERILGKHVPIQTLHRWLNEYKDRALALIPPQPEIDKIVTKTYADVVNQMTNLRQQLLDSFQEDSQAVIKNARLQERITSIAILSDKIDKATGIPADIQILVKELMHECDLIGYVPNEILQDMIATMRASRKAQHSITINPILPDAAQLQATTDDNKD